MEIGLLNDVWSPASKYSISEMRNRRPLKVRSRGKKREPITNDAKLKRKARILAVLARAADDSQFSARLDDNPSEALSDYYTLTQEEMTALVSGDIEKIESWLGKLDKRHATWLRHRLSQEKR